MALDWYFLRVQVGREDRIRESMVKRLKQEGIEAKVPQIVVPTETIADHRQGKKRIQRRKLYPGYLMVQMDLDEQVWFVLRETPGFGDFVGAQAHPTPARGEAVARAVRIGRSSRPTCTRCWPILGTTPARKACITASRSLGLMLICSIPLRMPG